MQIQYDLQNTLCEAQDLVDSLSKSNVLDIGDRGDAGLEKVEEELAVHAFNLGEFIDSLGLSKLGRKEPALGEIEKFLMEAARDEREKLGKDAVAEIPDVNRLGGLSRIMQMLEKNGVDRMELHRLDTKIKQLVVWVLRNEEELTMVKDLEGFGELGKWTKPVNPPKGVGPQKEHGQQNKDQDEEFPKLAPAVRAAAKPQKTQEEAKKPEDANQSDAELDDDYDTISMDSYVLV